jgi:hypothetical protein
MKRKYTKIGDILSVNLDDSSKKYIQYIASDLTQLNSDVIRAFKRVYLINEKPDLRDIVNGEVDFYAHCVTKHGIKSGHLELVGNDSEVGNTENILFRISGDYGNPQIEVSRDWWVWTINNEMRKVGILEGVNQRAEIGVVVPPSSIVYRMRMGKYDFKYQNFE